MCSHSSAGNEITEKISQQLYPAITELFHVSLEIEAQENNSLDFSWDIVYHLKSEFESLKNYELKLVFPSVLKVFNTKDKLVDKPTINIAELQKLTRNKEILIADLAADLAIELYKVDIAETHPLCCLQRILQTDFVQEKQKWHQMLRGWSIGCACFVAAQNTTSKDQVQNL